MGRLTPFRYRFEDHTGIDHSCDKDPKDEEEDRIAKWLSQAKPP
jgi:hypothetical protein